jgi:hypothetical protein
MQWLPIPHERLNVAEVLNRGTFQRDSNILGLYPTEDVLTFARQLCLVGDEVTAFALPVRVADFDIIGTEFIEPPLTCPGIEPHATRIGTANFALILASGGMTAHRAIEFASEQIEKSHSKTSGTQGDG